MAKKQPKLTPWFPAKDRPARTGVYQCRGNPVFAKGNYQYWNGKFWGGWASSPDDAKENADRPSIRKAPEWRGLAVRP